MTDEKDDDEVDVKELVEELSEEIKSGGTPAAEDTFALLPGEGKVIFIINNPPGQPGKAIAMELSPMMAAQLGNTMVACAIQSKLFVEEEEEETPKAKITWH